MLFFLFCFFFCFILFLFFYFLFSQFLFLFDFVFAWFGDFWGVGRDVGVFVILFTTWVFFSIVSFSFCFVLFFVSFRVCFFVYFGVFSLQPKELLVREKFSFLSDSKKNVFISRKNGLFSAFFFRSKVI